MGFFDHSHALRAAAFACGLFSFGTAALAGPAGLPYGLTFSTETGQPFGLSVAPVDRGDLHVKWSGVARRLEDERVQLALCDGDREHCASEAALKFLAIVDSGRQREGPASARSIAPSTFRSVRSTTSPSSARPMSGARRWRRFTGGPAIARIMRSQNISR
jgi:hypothetical protein